MLGAPPHWSSGTSRSPSLWRIRPLTSSRARAAGSTSRTLLVFLALGRREGWVGTVTKLGSDVLLLSSLSEGNFLLLPQGKCGRGSSPSPTESPRPGMPLLGGDEAQGPQWRLIVEPRN